MQTQITASSENLMFSERYEVDYLVNRYGVSRETARTILRDHFGDREEINSAAERLGRHARLYDPHGGHKLISS
jgi:hypothetical protein